MGPTRVRSRGGLRVGSFRWLGGKLLHEPLKLALALACVTLAVALVGLLFGLREGIRHQVTTFVDNAGADVYSHPGGRRFESG